MDSDSWPSPEMSEISETAEITGLIKILHGPKGGGRWQHKMEGAYEMGSSAHDLELAMGAAFASIYDMNDSTWFKVDQVSGTEFNFVVYGKGGVSYEDFETYTIDALDTCNGRLTSSFYWACSCCNESADSNTGEPGDYDKSGNFSRSVDPDDSDLDDSLDPIQCSIS